MWCTRQHGVGLKEATDRELSDWTRPTVPRTMYTQLGLGCWAVTLVRDHMLCWCWVLFSPLQICGGFEAPDAMTPIYSRSLLLCPTNHHPLDHYPFRRSGKVRSLRWNLSVQKQRLSPNQQYLIGRDLKLFLSRWTRACKGHRHANCYLQTWGVERDKNGS